MVQNHVSDIYHVSMPNDKITFAHLEVKNSPKMGIQTSHSYLEHRN